VEPPHISEDVCEGLHWRSTMNRRVSFASDPQGLHRIQISVNGS